MSACLICHFRIERIGLKKLDRSILLQDTKMDLLADQLNDYSRHGIPRLPHLLTFEADEDTEEALYRYRARIVLALVDWSVLCRWVKFLIIRGPSRFFFCATL